MSHTELELPNGIQGADGQWTKRVVIDEMTGEDEDILTDRSRADDGSGELSVSGPERVTQILSRCTVMIGNERRPKDSTRFNFPDFFAPVWRSAFSSDRTFALIKLRMVTHGHVYRFRGKCECGKEASGLRTDLTKLKVNSIPLEKVVTPDPFTLPKSGDILTWRPFVSSKDDNYISKVLEESKKDYASLLMLRRIVTVNGEPVKDGLQYIKRMNASDRRFMGKYMDNNEGGIETDCTWTCPKCGDEQHHRIGALDPSFFFPSETE